ncbi:hypothetical protein CWI39_1902p0010 [Hamiltosporidium magnivora]|uniref:Uncharacterized protein n=1 Tax=Hamiltosporidium magnivora TaxID=148818 RepID=A0A4Q9KYN8_9MICR|nr:hypothetical protein CWI39_1902p0010 [Hamiltosporidium magnivora]
MLVSLSTLFGIKNITFNDKSLKFATNDLYYEESAILVEGVSVYIYLGIIEDSRGIPTRSSFEEVQTNLYQEFEDFITLD